MRKVSKISVHEFVSIVERQEYDSPRDIKNSCFGVGCNECPFNNGDGQCDPTDRKHPAFQRVYEYAKDMVRRENLELI